MTQIKICGLTDPDLVRFTAQAGADWIGFVFAEASPRFVTEAAAASLLMQVGRATPVASGSAIEWSPPSTSGTAPVAATA